MSAPAVLHLDWQPLPLPPCALGESPFWWPEQGALWWVDIDGCALHRWHPAEARHDHWPLPAQPGCAAPLPGGALLLALRSGLHRFDPLGGDLQRRVDAPYDPASQRFNDGRADPAGRLWVGSLCEPRTPPRAALYRWADGRLDEVFGDVSVGNGLACSPDGRTLYFSDTFAHRVFAFDLDVDAGTLSRRRVFAAFDPPGASPAPPGYGGRPDGAAVDAEGGYWSAMYEGGRLLRFAPDGRLLAELPLPVRCPTMPCFGGPDLRTLYVTSARRGRPADELAAHPWSGRVLQARVEVPGLPVHFAADR